MTKKNVKSTAGKPIKGVKELACEQPKPLQEKSTVKEAGETMRSLHTERFPVAAGDQLVGTVEGNYPERKAAGFGHDPETTLVQETMEKKIDYCFEHQSIEEVLEMMRRDKLQHLPVVDEKLRVIGILALHDVECEHQQAAEDEQGKAAGAAEADA